MKQVKRFLQALAATAAMTFAVVSMSAAPTDAAEQNKCGWHCTEASCDQECGGPGAGVCSWVNGCPKCLCLM